MIYTLTFNPSLDYIVTVPKFTCGVVNRHHGRDYFPRWKRNQRIHGVEEPWL